MRFYGIFSYSFTIDRTGNLHDPQRGLVAAANEIVDLYGIRFEELDAPTDTLHYHKAEVLSIDGIFDGFTDTVVAGGQGKFSADWYDLGND